MCYKVYNEHSEEPSQEGAEEPLEAEEEDPRRRGAPAPPAMFPNNQHNLLRMSK